MTRVLRLNPDIEWSTRQGGVRASLPLFGLEISGSKALKETCELFAGAGLAEDSTACAHIDKGAIAELVNAFILLDATEFEFLENGLVAPAANWLGRSLDLSTLDELGPNAAVVLGAPIVTTRGHHSYVGEGAARVREHLRSLLHTCSEHSGDAEIIDFDLGQSIRASDADLWDLGDVIFSAETDSPSLLGKRLSKAVDLIALRKGRPIVLGGDHATTYFVLDALRRHVPEFGVIHFDAHHDFYLTKDSSRDPPLNHANVMAFIRDLPEVRSITQIGLRDLYAPPAGRRRYRGSTEIECISSREVRHRPPADVFSKLDPALPYYITFDVDVLEGAGSRTTATPAFGGVSYWDAFELLQHAFSSFEIFGFDAVEVSGEKHSDHLTAHFAARAAMLYLFSLRGHKRLAGHVFV